MKAQVGLQENEVVDRLTKEETRDPSGTSNRLAALYNYYYLDNDLNKGTAILITIENFNME